MRVVSFWFMGHNPIYSQKPTLELLGNMKSVKFNGFSRIRQKFITWTHDKLWFLRRIRFLSPLIMVFKSI